VTVPKKITLIGHTRVTGWVARTCCAPQKPKSSADMPAPSSRVLLQHCLNHGMLHQRSNARLLTACGKYLPYRRLFDATALSSIEYSVNVDVTKVGCWKYSKIRVLVNIENKFIVWGVRRIKIRVLVNIENKFIVWGVRRIEKYCTIKYSIVL
jgi:hypothetical protein